MGACFQAHHFCTQMMTNGKLGHSTSVKVQYVYVSGIDVCIS